MSGLCIIGAGGHGKVVADCAAACGRWSDIVFLDDGLSAGTVVGDWPVAGSIDDTARIKSSHPDVVVALGDSSLRVSRLMQCAEQGFSPVSVVHPRAFVSPAASLGGGTVVLAQAAVNTGTVVGLGGIINTGAVVDHDCELGEGVHVAPGASIAGSVMIGDHTWIGLGASVIQSRHIGSHVMVAAGAVVIRDVESRCTVAGVPAASLNTVPGAS